MLRAWHCHLCAGFHQCKSFVEMCTVRCCPLWHPAYCPMGTVPRVLVRRTASPTHADFGGLNSGAAPVVVRLDVVPLQSRSSTPTVVGCQLGGYPAGRDQWGGKQAVGGMSEDHDRCFSMLVLGHFRQLLFLLVVGNKAVEAAGPCVPQHRHSHSVIVLQGTMTTCDPANTCDTSVSCHSCCQ